jgi:hypothetical protein
MDIKEKLVEIAEGVYVEEDTLRIVEKIKEFDPRLRVKYHGGKPEMGEAPYMITELCTDGVERIVFSVWQLDDRIIEKLHQSDSFKLDIQSQIDSENARVRKNVTQRYQELQQEAHEIAHAVTNSSKDTYKVEDPLTGNKLKFVSDKRGVVDYGK